MSGFKIENGELKLVKIDFDKLYDESEAAGRIGECPLCEFDGDYTHHVLCWCGVCLKYHHNDYFHEDIDDFEPPY